MAPRFVSLYSGAGGLDLGFIAAGFEPVLSNDMDPSAMGTNAAMLDTLGIVGHAAVVGDVSKARERLAEGCANLVVGGPPCQGFSVGGKMDPDDPRSRQVFNFLDVVGQVRPEIFVMENVKALAVSERWSTVRDSLLGIARELGYRTRIAVLNSVDYGVPQRRERMFLVGFLDPDAPFEYPAPTVGRESTVRDALATLPPYGLPGNDQKSVTKITILKKPVIRKSPYAGMLFNGRGRPLDLDRSAPTLAAAMGGSMTPIVDQETLETGARPWVEWYRDHLADGGRVAERAPERLRRITVEEAAAIQSFPVDMPWSGARSARYRQIGNAVPPKMAHAVARSVARALNLDAEDRPEILDRLGDGAA